LFSEARCSVAAKSGLIIPSKQPSQTGRCSSQTEHRSDADGKERQNKAPFSRAWLFRIEAVFEHVKGVSNDSDSLGGMAKKRLITKP